MGQLQIPPTRDLPQAIAYMRYTLLIGADN
jgi:hypothetical protein